MCRMRCGGLPSGVAAMRVIKLRNDSRLDVCTVQRRWRWARMGCLCDSGKAFNVMPGDDSSRCRRCRGSVAGPMVARRRIRACA